MQLKISVLVIKKNINENEINSSAVKYVKKTFNKKEISIVAYNFKILSNNNNNTKNINIFEIDANKLSEKNNTQFIFENVKHTNKIFNNSLDYINDNTIMNKDFESEKLKLDDKSKENVYNYLVKRNKNIHDKKYPTYIYRGR